MSSTMLHVSSTERKINTLCWRRSVLRWYGLWRSGSKYMLKNYGTNALSQFDVWVSDCRFPEKGNFSSRQIEQLKNTLEDKERHTFKAGWKAFGLWQLETHRREIKQAGTSPSSQCLLKFQKDPDLNSAPLRRPKHYCGWQNSSSSNSSTSNSTSEHSIQKSL